MKSYSVAIQMKATEQYFPVVLFIVLYIKLVINIKDGIPKCGRSVPELVENYSNDSNFCNCK